VSKNLRYKVIIVLIVIASSLYFLYPTFRVVSMDEGELERIEKQNPEKYDELLNKSIKLGLDLKGGMHLVLEVDDSRLDEDEKKDVMDRAIEIIRNRVDQFGVSEPTIQKEGSKRIIVQLPGLQDAERAKRLIGQTAMLEWRLIRQQEEMVSVLKKIDEVLKEEHGDSLVEVPQEKLREEVETQVSDTAVVPPIPLLELETETAAVDTSREDTSLVEPLEDMKIDIPLETVSKDNPFSSLFRSVYRDWLLAEEANIPKINNFLAMPEVQEAIPEDSELIWFDEWTPLRGGGRGKFIFLVGKEVNVSGANLVNASPRTSARTGAQMEVSFMFNREGARKFARFTGENVGRFTAIILDGKIKSFPQIRTKIPGGSGVIEGNFTDEEARDLSIVLRAGALPAPMIPREERTVGPSLGKDSIRLGLKAAIFGLAAVVLFMLIYYKLSGGLASIALALNLVILLGLLAYLGAALTLPGIAGIILTIGMAIDANVLIFERIREELRKEKTIRSAIDAGYDRAFTTILDANLTTLITALVLWQFGTGPIKGFATTLSIGIIASMFTALVFSRMVFQLVTQSGKVKKLSI
jgi:SecD/SecF fusion protein